MAKKEETKKPRRFVCNYAYARMKPEKKDAIYQRGAYYVLDLEGKRDTYRYGIFLNDSMLGMTGTLVNAKRYCQSVYIKYPMEQDVSPSMELEGLNKKYRVKPRKTMKVSKRKPKKRNLQKKSLIGRNLFSEFLNRYQIAADMLLEAQESKKPTKTEYNKAKRLAADAIKEMQDNEPLFEPLDFLQLIGDFQNIIQNVEDDTARLFPTKKKTAPTAGETKQILMRALSCETVEETKKELKKLKAVKNPPKHVKEAIEIIENTRCK